MIIPILSKVCTLICISSVFTSVGSPSINPTQQPSLIITAAPTPLLLIQNVTCVPALSKNVAKTSATTKEDCAHTCLTRINPELTGCCVWIILEIPGTFNSCLFWPAGVLTTGGPNQFAGIRNLSI
jgi:hypothetical protein